MTRGRAASALLLFSTSLLPAQEASVFLGGSHARYADSLSGTAGFAAVRLEQGGGLRAWRLDASFSQFTDSGWALQFGGQTTAFWRTGSQPGSPYAGFAVGGAFNDFQGGTSSGTVAGGPVAVLPLGGSLLTLGATGGALRRIDARWIGLGSGSVRWQLRAGGQVALDLGAAGTIADTLRLVDVSVGVRWRGPSARVGAVVGTRAGDLSEGMWGSLEAMWAPVPHVALEASAGRYPPDLTGFADGVFAQVGVRLFVSRAPGPYLPPRALALVVQPRANGVVRVTVRLGESAATVAIAGDWNEWEPVPLRPDGTGRWVAELRLGPGIYKYGLLADGEWTLPEGVAGMDDGFGGRVGVLVVK